MDTKTRYDEMRGQFVTFHHAHPEVFQLFERFAFEMVNAGFEHGAAMMIVQRIRWETGVVLHRGNDFKINNNFAPFYARLFMHRHQQLNGFFRTRVQTSKSQPATNLPPLMPRDFD